MSDIRFKALSLTQPWASLVQRRAKRVETRSWYTSYRGPLVIHAAKGYPAWCKEFAAEPYTRDALGCQLDPFNLPLGVGLCVVTLLACVKTTELHKLKAIDFRLSVNEITFGDYGDGRWAWALEHQYDFIRPIPAKGALGLWAWPHEIYQVLGDVPCANVNGPDATTSLRAKIASVQKSVVAAITTKTAANSGKLSAQARGRAQHAASR